MFNSILRIPDFVEVQTSDKWNAMDKRGEEFVSPQCNVKLDVTKNGVSIY